jgi:hypothetical protein
MRQSQRDDDIASDCGIRGRSAAGYGKAEYLNAARAARRSRLSPSNQTYRPLSATSLARHTQADGGLYFV